MNFLHLNGSRCEKLVAISLYNPSFLYGVNCFEGIRAYWAEDLKKLVFLDLDAHLDRLYDSMEQLSFSEPTSKSKLRMEIQEMIEVEEVREDVYIRVTVFIGEDGSWRTIDGIHYMVSIRSMPSRLGTQTPVRIGISRFHRISNHSMPPQVKAGGNYLNSRYALLDVAKRGFDEALFLTNSGTVSEATGSAVFFIKSGTILTPSLDCDLLKSITRMRLIQICKTLAIPVEERHIDPSEIPAQEAAFLVGTAVEMRPIMQIEKKRLDSAHPIYLALVRELLLRIKSDTICSDSVEIS